MSNNWFSKLLIVLLFVFISGTVISGRQAVLAQDTPTSWSQPINLSKSGAASLPLIVASQTGIMQSFWMDRFDGLTSAVFDGQTWSEPRPTPLPNRPLVMPFIIADGSGWTHAFWQETGVQNTPVNSLYHSQMPLGGSGWSSPELVAEDALAYSVYAPANKGLSLAYIRRVNTEFAPAGVYVRRLDSGGSPFGPSSPVFSSIYYRLSIPGDTNLSIADDGNGNIYLIWKDPYQAQILYSHSIDNGVSWFTPTFFGDPGYQISNPRLGAMPGTTLAIWQEINPGECSLYQQNWTQPAGPSPQITQIPGEATPTLSGAGTSEPTVIGGDNTPQPTSTPTAPILANSTGWSVPVPIFQGLQACPTTDRFWPKADNSMLIWLWDEGTSNIRLTVWDPAQSGWSLLQNINVQFNDPGTGQLIILGDLHAALSAEKIAVTGIDANGEVWVTMSEQGIGELAFAPPPLWSPAQPIVNGNEQVNNPVIVMDRSERAHLVWTQSANIGSVGASLLYSYWEPSNTSSDQLQANQSVLYPGNPDEIIRQPNILVDEARSLLYLAVSGGLQGEILFSKAPLDSAGSPGEWASPRIISGGSFSQWPQLAMDSKNGLYVLYTIPINEGRGVYLVKSDDRGETWLRPVTVFDAAGAGVAAVDHPTLAVTPEGVIYTAWVESIPQGNGQTQAILFSESKDNGLNWSSPITLAGAGNDWPKLIVNNDLIHIFYAQIDDSAGNASGTVMHSYKPLATQSEGEESVWSPVSRLPGWKNTSLPFGATQSGSADEASIHLVGASSDDASIYYSTWVNGSWSPPEVTKMTGINTPGSGLQAATSPEGGLLTLAWQTVTQPGQPDLPTFFFASRTIPDVQAPLAPTIQASPTPTLEITLTPTPNNPTPTPDLNTEAFPEETTISPVLLAGAVAGLIIIGLFAWRTLITRRRK